MRTFLTPPPSFISHSSRPTSKVTPQEQWILFFRHLPPHSSHSSRPIRKVTPQEQRMEAEGNADKSNEDEGNADEGNEDEMYLFELF